ncbi:MAG: glycosyltransferase family 4 protein [Bacteroidales bacterium]
MSSVDHNARQIVILGSAWPLRGGIAAFNQRLAQEYRSMGNEVIIYTFSLQYPSFLFPGKTQYTDEPKPPFPEIRATVNSVNPLSWIRTGREIKKLRPDLLIVPFWIPFMGMCLGTIAGIVRKNRYTRIISLVHNMIPHERRIGDLFFSRYFVRSVDGFVAMSQSVLDDIGKFDNKKPRVLSPHPLYDHFGEIGPKELARKALGLEPSGRYVLFFGLIRDYKGLDILLRAMATDQVRNLDVKLIVAGEFYSDPSEYHHMIEILKLDKRVVIHGEFIPDSKVAHYFNASDLVVQPYKTATQSGVTQIAYHFHKPMVVTNVGGLAEIVPHGLVGYVVNPDHQEVARAIADFYSGNKEEVMRANAELEKKKYSWSVMSGSIDRV